MPDLKDKIQEARSLPSLPHSEKLVEYKNFEELFLDRCSEYSKKTFLTYYSSTCKESGKCNKTSFTYEELKNNVYKTVELLRSKGIKKGDRIATISHNHSDTVFQYFAAWVLGAVVVPINVKEDNERISFILNNSETKLAFVREDYLKKVSEIQKVLKTNLAIIKCYSSSEYFAQSEKQNRPNVDLCALDQSQGTSNKDKLPELNTDCPALIVYTSGTTGNPKGVVLSQYNILVDAKYISEWHKIDSKQTMMCVLPVHHVNGTIVTLATPLFAGASIVLNEKFQTGEFFKRISEEKVNVVSVVPTLLAFLLEGNKEKSLTEGLDLSSFRHIICGAGPLTVDLALEFEKEFKTPIIHGYGLSETTCYSCFLPIDLKEEKHKHWLKEFGFPSIGAPLLPNEMDIHDDEGKSLQEGQRGEIVIRGHNVMIEYFNNPEANAEAFKHGWFRSGDEGFFKLDKEGNKYFFITGRLKELIIRGGINVSPLEIDEVIMSIPGVKAGISVGFENDFYGEEIGAYVQLEDTAKLTQEEIIKACAKELPFHKQPKVVIFGDELPVTSTGKYQRNKLKASFLKYKGSQFRK